MSCCYFTRIRQGRVPALSHLIPHGFSHVHFRKKTLSFFAIGARMEIFGSRNNPIAEAIPDLYVYRVFSGLFCIFTVHLQYMINSFGNYAFHSAPGLLR